GHVGTRVHRRGHVVNRHGGGGGPRGAVVVGHHDADGVDVRGRPAGVVVQVLVRGAEGQHARGEGQRGAALPGAPGDDHRVGIQRVRVAEGPAHDDRVVLVDRGRGDGQGAEDWAEILREEVFAGGGAFGGDADPVGAGDQRLVLDELVAAVAQGGAGGG